MVLIVAVLCALPCLPKLRRLRDDFLQGKLNGVILPKTSTIVTQSWETDFYTPPVLGGALLDNSEPTVHKNSVP